MAKKQTRRSISVRGTTYDRLRLWCEAHTISMSEFLEQRIAEYLDGSADKAQRAQAVAAVAAMRPPVTSQLTARPQPRPALRVAAPTPVAASRPPVAAPATTYVKREFPAARPAVTPTFSQPARALDIPARREVSTPVPPRSVEAARPIRQAAPPPAAARSAGRPAPTPADKVLKVYKQDERADGSDYRAIRF